MQKSILYGIIAAIAVAAGIGIASAATLMAGPASSSQLPPSADSGNEIKVVKHVGGETEIPKSPKRIVVLDSELAENMLVLSAGDSIVGASLWATFDSSFEEEMQKIGLSVPSHIVDVGDYWQPNLESIAELEPDLIIISDVWNKLIYDDLNKIAPTLMFATYPSDNRDTITLEEMEQTFKTLAYAVDRLEEGSAALERLHTKSDKAAAKIESAGLKGEKFVVTEVWVFEDKPEMYLYTRNSVASQTLEKVGLQNALTSDQDAQWGLITAGPEGLASVALENPDLHFFFGHYDTVDETNYYDTRDMVRNGAVWKNMEFNKRNQAYELGAEFKPRATPRHMEALLDKVVEALVPSNGTRTISHAMGETEITGTPERIIPLDTVAVEFLLAAGIEPVGAASIADHKNWSPEISTKWPNVVDVGETWEPNFEVMAQLEPDLIIGMQAAHSEMYDELSDIAPTILLDNWPPEDGPTMLEAVERNTMLIADILGRHEGGIEFLESFNAKLDQNERRLEAAGLKGAKFILADVWVFEGDPQLRLYVPNAQGVETLERMGLKSVVPAPQEFQRFGNIDASLEVLAALDGPDVHFMYLQAPGEDPLTDPKYWGNSPVWKNLSFVKEERVYPFGSINMFRGVLMLEKLADKAIDELTKQG